MPNTSDTASWIPNQVLEFPQCRLGLFHEPFDIWSRRYVDSFSSPFSDDEVLITQTANTRQDVLALPLPPSISG